MNKYVPKLHKYLKDLPRTHSSTCWPMPSYGPMEIQRSQMINGIQIAAAKTCGIPMTACTVTFQAGSRCETNDDLGASHFLRAASTCSGCEFTGFSKMRVLQQKGAYLTCTSDRQSIAYTLRCPLPAFADLKYYLLDTAARCCYHNWEISDLKAQVRGDIHRIHPQQRVIDLVQKACWSGPLSNSIFCEEERIDSVTGDTLRNFVKYNFKPSQCSVASYGVPFEETLKLVENIDTSKDKVVCEPCPLPRPRAGFEYYDLGSGSDTWIAVAVPGCGTCDPAGVFKHAIAAAACGTGDMEAGQHELDRIPESPLGLMAGHDVFTQFRAFNISYADTGLFGIVAKTRAATACRTALGIAEFLTNVGDLNFTQIETGKKRLQLDLALNEEDVAKVSEGIALQLASNVQIDNAQVAIAMVDAICPDEVTATVKALSAKCHEMAVAVVGDIGAVPTDQEMLCR